jgi:hypothetical protein
MSFVAVLASVVVGAGCVPPPVAAPQLPAGVGVRWVRDTGANSGTVDPESGYYAPSYDRYQLLDGVVTGPTPAGEVPDPFPPQFDTSPFLPAHRPDGTARFPSNGFAGEGITMTAVGEEYAMSFPSGSCTFGSRESTRSVYPSPDGTRAAVYDLSTEADSNSIYVVSLVDGGSCPFVSGELHVVIPGESGDRVQGPVVWSPASDAVVYTVADIAGGGTTTSVLHRLDATPGATSTTIGSPSGVDDQLIPLGWSVADRLLTWTVTAGPVYTLATMPVAGGAQRVIERKDVSDVLVRTFHFGYFVPGTTTIVFNSMSKIVTNPTGQQLVWPRIRRVADADGAVSAPLTGSNPPLTWHQEALAGGPPFTLIDVPDAELFERFVH